MRPLPSYPLLVWLCSVFLQLGCQRSEGPPTLSELHGCDDVWHEPGTREGGGETYVCALAESTGAVPRVWVQVAAPSGFALGASHSTTPGGRGYTTQLTATDRLIIDIDRAALPQLVTLTASSPLGGATSGPAVHLRLIKQQLLPIEAVAEAARQHQTLEQGIVTLQSALGTPPYSTDRAAGARLLHALADLELDASRPAAALQHFDQALKLAEPAGLTLIVANSARLLAFQHYALRRDIPTALKIMDRYDAAIRMVDIESALGLYNRGVYAQERGRLSEAVRLLGAAKAAVKDLGEEDSRRGIAKMYAVVLAQQGLSDRAEQEVQELLAEVHRPSSKWAVCERMRILNTLGWVRILGREARSLGVQDPIPLFAEALLYRTPDQCVAETRSIAMNWARAELLAAEQLADAAAAGSGEPSPELRSHLQKATERLAEGTAAESQPSISKQLDTAEVRGRIAYLRADFGEAERQFARLAALAGDAEEPDYQARALIGQALVSAALGRTADPKLAEGYTKAARAAFEQAEAQLDGRLGLVPLTAARRAFLPRFAAGTAAFIDFLLAQGDRARALEVARRAQVRGLVATLSFDTLNLLPEPQRSRLTQERDEFVRQSELPGNQAATAQRFEKLLAELRAAGLGQLQLHHLQPGEAMHLCHPLPHGELVCFVADANEIAVARLSAQAVQAASPAELARLLLTPFAQLINRAQVLRVVPSPTLRKVNFPALPWPGESGYLAADERLVVHALDLELGNRAAVPEGVRGKALMLENLSLEQAQKNAPGLFARLQELGWKVQPYTNQQFVHGTNLRRKLRCWLDAASCPPPLALPVASRPGTAAEMRLGLPQVELAQLDTHAFYDRASGWQSALIMPDGSQLQVFDLLTLARAPRWTVLLVCEGGTAGKDSDADDISLAQALLLRGGEAVVAATRPLEDALSGKWAQALYGPKGSPTAYLSAAKPSLTAAFRAAQSTLRRDAQYDWSALRLFVP